METKKKNKLTSTKPDAANPAIAFWLAIGGSDRGFLIVVVYFYHRGTEITEV